jgi:ring-1,2-phenylacetyl-CoA epoxidase subunit PaaB
VPISAIYSRTAQELESTETANLEESRAGQDDLRLETYYVFSKRKSAGTQTFLGEVEAPEPSLALRSALEKFNTHKAFAWWVFPARQVTASSLEDIESMFAPAGDKPFRLSTDFHTLTAMRALRQERSE